MGQKFQHALIHLKLGILLTEGFNLGLQNAQAQLVIGGVQINHQAALQARLDAVFQVLDLTGGTVARDDDLLVLVHQRVERVEELFLGAVLAGDELHVIDHQHIDRAEHLFEIHHLAVTQRLHETVHELFRRQVDHVQVRAAGLQFPGDGMHKMGFTKTHAAIKKERVEGDRAAFSHALGSGMGQFVGLANHERVKGKALIQRRRRHQAIILDHRRL